MSETKQVSSSIEQNSSTLKWVMIGCLGMSTLFFMVVFCCFYFFSPFFEFDKDQGQLRLFGGLVKIDANTDMVKVSNSGSVSFGVMTGTRAVPESVDTMIIKYGSGAMKVHGEEGVSGFRWKCEGAGATPEFSINDEQTQGTFDVSAALTSCDLYLSPRKGVVIEGLNGELMVENIASPVDVHLIRGQIQWRPAVETEYNYSVSVEDGSMDEWFHQQGSKKSIPVTIKLQQGSIQHLD